MREWRDRIVEPPEPQPILCDCGHWQGALSWSPLYIDGKSYCEDCVDSGRIVNEDDEEQR